MIGRIGGLAATPDSRIVWPYRYGQLLRGDLVKNYVERPAPGHMWMQFMGHYTPDAGLLWYVEDALGFLKFASHGKERDGKLVLGWRERPWLDGSGRYELPFPYVFVPFGKCDYHDFAAVYADWARQQPWAQVSAAEKLAARPALANAVFDGKVKSPDLKRSAAINMCRWRSKKSGPNSPSASLTRRNSSAASKPSTV